MKKSKGSESKLMMHREQRKIHMRGAEPRLLDSRIRGLHRQTSSLSLLAFGAIKVYCDVRLKRYSLKSSSWDKHMSDLEQTE